MRLIQDTKVIQDKEQIAELLRAVVERLPTVIENEAGANVHKERREAQDRLYEDIERQLDMLSRFKGINIGNVPGEDVNQRLKARHNLAMTTRNFLNSYDHIAKDQRGNPSNSDFDPKLMRIIVLAVRAHDAFEAARGDIIGNLIIPGTGKP